MTAVTIRVLVLVPVNKIALHVSDLVPRIALVRKASQRSRRRVWLPLPNAVLYEAIRTHRAVLDAGLGRDVFSKCCSERGSVAKRDRHRAELQVHSVTSVVV